MAIHGRWIDQRDALEFKFHFFGGSLKKKRHLRGRAQCRSRRLPNAPAAGAGEGVARLAGGVDCVVRARRDQRWLREKVAPVRPEQQSAPLANASHRTDRIVAAAAATVTIAIAAATTTTTTTTTTTFGAFLLAALSRLASRGRRFRWRGGGGGTSFGVALGRCCCSFRSRSSSSSSCCSSCCSCSCCSCYEIIQERTRDVLRGGSRERLFGAVARARPQAHGVHV